MVEINGVPFEEHPDIHHRLYDEATNTWYPEDPTKTYYKFNYTNFAMKVQSGEWDALSVWRQAIKEDLWFLVYFIIKPFSDEAGRARVNHPFIVQACRDLEEGPVDFTLDVWAREHFKTSIITIAETIQFQLKNPEFCTGIFSYVAPKAKQFLFSIRSILEREIILHKCFPDVLFDNPQKDAPLWSIDQGIIMRRKTNRQEPSIGAYGLTEGMPTGLHFERRVYDDITTEDITGSFDIMEKIELKFDSSQNLGKEGGHHRVTGTYYDHIDPLIYIRNKTRYGENGTDIPAYTLRFKPATDDGTATGRPVLISQKRLDELKLTKTFNCQQLLDPTPLKDRKLNPDYLNPIDPKFIPRSLFRFMTIDQAGDEPTNKSAGDKWAMGVFAVEPISDQLGQCKVYIEDLWISPAGEAEAIEQAIRMYIKAGMIMKIGVEKVGQVTTHLRISEGLRARGRHIDFGELDEHKNGVLLRPAGRHKKKFIENSLAWPLNNGKLFYSTDIPGSHMDTLKREMSLHPLWHDDGINAWAYVYDLISVFRFPQADDEEEEYRPIRKLGRIY